MDKMTVELTSLDEPNCEQRIGVAISDALLRHLYAAAAIGPVTQSWVGQGETVQTITPEMANDIRAECLLIADAMLAKPGKQGKPPVKDPDLTCPDCGKTGDVWECHVDDRMQHCCGNCRGLWLGKPSPPGQSEVAAAEREALDAVAEWRMAARDDKSPGTVCALEVKAMRKGDRLIAEREKQEAEGG